MSGECFCSVLYVEDWFSMFLVVRKLGISENMFTYTLPQVEKGHMKEFIS
jgi:hypothetical protein